MTMAGQYSLLGTTVSVGLAVVGSFMVFRMRKGLDRVLFDRWRGLTQHVVTDGGGCDAATAEPETIRG